MTVREYFKRISSKYRDVTFIKARARKDANTPYYHQEYQITPLRMVDEWKHSIRILDSIVLNDRQNTITWLSGVDWNVQINEGSAKCLLIIHPEDFELLYPSKEQRNAMEKYIEEKLFK